MRILKYNNKKVQYYCEKCDIYGEYNLKSILSDNCVVSVDILCDLCSNSKTLLILLCNDQSMAPILKAQWEVLNEKRYKDNANKDKK